MDWRPIISVTLFRLAHPPAHFALVVQPLQPETMGNMAEELRPAPSLLPLRNLLLTTPVRNLFSCHCLFQQCYVIKCILILIIIRVPNTPKSTRVYTCK